VEELDERARAKAVADLAEGTFGDRSRQGQRPDEAQAAAEAVEDVGEGLVSEEAHGDGQEQGKLGRQRAAALFGGVKVRNDLTNGGVRDSGFEGVKSEVVGKVGRARDWA
jgi:hypothetical protein